MANRLIQLKEQLNKMDLMKKMGVYLNEDQRPDIEAEIKLLEQEQEQHTLTNTPKEVLKLKMSSLTIKEPQLHTNTLLDEAHTNSLLNKNKKLKKNNKRRSLRNTTRINNIFVVIVKEILPTNVMSVASLKTLVGIESISVGIVSKRRRNKRSKRRRRRRRSKKTRRSNIKSN
jgi:hypothetical protein